MLHYPSSFERFLKLGYQLFNNVIPLELASALHRLLAAELEQAFALLSPFVGKADVMTAGVNISTLLASSLASTLDRETRALMTGHFPTALRLSQDFWEVARTPALRKILEAALGSDHLRMHMPPMARFILPNNSEAGVPPHRDASYNTHMNNFVTVWILLVEIDEKCGGVTIYEGRKDGLIPATRMVQNGIWIEGVSVQGLKPVACVPMVPGDILVFNPYVVHGSMPNVSKRIRFSMDCRFFGAVGHSSKHYLDMATWCVVTPEKAGV